MNVDVESVSKVAAMEPIPAGSVKAISQTSFWGRFFGLGNQKIIEALQSENQELIAINLRSMETIKSLSKSLSEQLEKIAQIGQSNAQYMLKNILIVEELPEKLNTKMDSLQKRIMDIFDRATFFIQNTSQGLLEAKNELVTLQNDALDGMGALEIAEFMRSFLVVNLLSKQIKNLFQNTNNHISNEELEVSCQKLQKNLQIVKNQMDQINFKLEKYNLRIEESLLKPFQEENQSIELTECCSAQSFHRVVKLCQKFGIISDMDKIDSVVIAEVIPSVSFFNKDKGNWATQRPGRIVVLVPSAED